MSTIQNASYVPRANRVSEPEQDESPIEQMITPLIESRWLILLIVALTVVAGTVYAYTAQPVYRSDILLQIEDKKQGLAALEELSPLVEEQSSVEAEFQIITSRMVLGRVVDNLKLDLTASPVMVPVLGSVLPRLTEQDAPAEPLIDMSPWLDLSEYGWGGERIDVASFEVEPQVRGESFSLVAGRDGTYQLLTGDQRPLGEGKVGKPFAGIMPDESEFRLFVRELKARPGTRFSVVRQKRLSAINRLKQDLRITEEGEKSGMVRLSLEGHDRQRIRDILNEIGTIYVRQNVERKSAEAEKTLQFLEQQLPKLRDQMEQAEAALNSYRLSRGSVDLPLETQAILEKSVQVEAELTTLQRQRDELLQRFTVQHPRIAAIDDQITTLRRELDKVETNVKKLPSTQQEILRLQRDAEVRTALYTQLLNNAQETRVIRAGTVGNVRIVDDAVTPTRPVKPKKQLIVASSLLLGGILGAGIALMRHSLRRGVKDPDDIERRLGLPVYAVVPKAKGHGDLRQRILSGSKAPRLLAISDPQAPTIESLRSLRTSLHFAQLGTKNKTLLIAGPSPGVGKSFIAANLGAVLASAGSRVVLVDGDLRRGKLHHLFGHERKGGLSELIVGGMQKEPVCRTTGIENLDLITTGVVPPNPAELLLHQRFATVIERLNEKYDYVILDSPPVLAVTDPAIIGRVAGATLLVVRDGLNPVREIEQSVKRLHQAGVNLRGVVFNAMETVGKAYGYGRYYGVGYSYQHAK